MASMANSTLLPFLYPCLINCTWKRTWRPAFRAREALKQPLHSKRITRTNSFSTRSGSTSEETDSDRLNPAPSDYGRFIFQDRCTLKLKTGSGGSGCVSFLREKYISEGPANGGDGGTGGSIYIQAIDGHTSLHKLARKGVIRAGQGRNGKGKLQGGHRGSDVLIQVPVGTVVREVGRYDPVAEKEDELRGLMGKMREEEALRFMSSKPEQWVLYPGAQPSEYLTTDFPTLSSPRRPNIAAAEPQWPISLDLSYHMEKPLLLAAGAVGGYGNPHFVSRENPRPTFATRGEGGKTLELELELKLLADVGLVGLPNAGKSTLLRSITNSRARIGHWAFTTLSPNIGTVVLDDLTGHPVAHDKSRGQLRSRFTIADIPGLVEDAHLDKGLGIAFLRHIERAGILAFVVDLSEGDAVQVLKGLWRELDEYQLSRDERMKMDSGAVGSANPTLISELDGPRVVDAYAENQFEPRIHRRKLPELTFQPVYTKPWFVIGTKADLPETQSNFASLREYLTDVERGVADHPSRRENAWRARIQSIPVSAINAEGVNTIPQTVVQLLDGH